MTIAINAKIHEGVVLASDSATTLMDQSGRVINVYEHANKIFNIYKGLPIGVITYGLGNIGHASIATLAKDFRVELIKTLNPLNYELKDIANKFSSYIEDLYNNEFKSVNKKQRPILGFVVAGYSSDRDLPEEYQIIFPNNSSPVLVRPIREVGITWNGEIEPLTRLVLGHGSNLEHTIRKNLNCFKGKNEAMAFAQDLQQNSQVRLINPGMPIQDVIYLAEYLASTAVNFAKFRPGAQTVGGPIEIAVISKHEGFKWVKRKHYYSTELNHTKTTENPISQKNVTTEKENEKDD